MKTFQFLFLLVLLFPDFCFSQGEFNQWRFGRCSGLDFNSGIPVPVPSWSSTFLSGFVNSSVSDSLGNLLFYTDWLAVYNKNNTILQNSTPLESSNSAYQCSFSVKQLQYDNLYYLFTMNSCFEAGGDVYGLHYSVIDMSLDSGLGGIIPGQKNIPVPRGENVYVVITGTRAKNNRDAWIVVRESLNSYSYLTYKITSSGLDTLPVISNSLIRINSNGNCSDSLPVRLRISPDGTKLICIYQTVAEYCNFNTLTGQISPLFLFPPSTGSDFDQQAANAEFSTKTNFLYLSNPGNNYTISNPIYQYDATKTDSAQFTQSMIIIGDNGPYAKAGMQMGPDGKIYVSHAVDVPPPTIDSVSVIEHPSLPGLACGFKRSILKLNTNGGGNWGFPQFLQKYKAYIHHSGLCQHDSVNFSGDIWPPADSIHWDFGDPASGPLNYSNDPGPTHIYQGTGTYTVELFVRHNDNRTDTSWQIITILDSPHPALGQDRSICTGDSAMLDAGSWINSTYAWDNLSLGLMNIASTQTYYAKTTGDYRVTVTNSNGCIGMDTVQVSLTTPPSVSNNPLSKSICSGDSTNIPLTSSPLGANFHWTATLTSGTVSGFSADSGQAINQTLINNGVTTGVVTYHITPKVGDCIGNSVDYTVTVTPGVSVTINISSSTNNVCEGTSVTFNAHTTYGGSSPLFQWKVNGVISGLNDSVFTYIPATADVVSCTITSSNTICISNNPATSNSITMTVNPNLAVSVTITAVPSTVCAGSTMTFTANPTSGGLTPSYQWKVNGINVGINSPNYSYIPINGDLVSCTLTSSETCTTNNPASSLQYPVSVSPILPVSVMISTPSNPFCLGSSVTFIGAPVNGAPTATFQWVVNGINVGSNSNTYTYFPVNGDLVNCVYNSPAPCLTGNPATSNTIIMVQNNSLPAAVSITATSNPFCPGSSVTFTAAPTHGGPTPAYQWKVNGVNVGTNSNTYSYNPNNGDSVRVIMTSNLPCVTGSPASSAKIIMSGTLAPIVTFAACFDTITTINAKPIKLKGGIPLGGIYSGPGVNSGTGYFNPALAGVGIKTITYSYTNASSCSATKSISILDLPSSILACGNPLTDPRDNKVYQTVQIGGQCWLAEDLNYGNEIPNSQDQRDNCIAEKYHNPGSSIQHPASAYEWDEVMQYDETTASQGFCPPSWHIPSENDWNNLFATYINSGFAGSPLKYSGFSGFNALLSGIRNINKTWDYQGFAVFFWSSTSRSDSKAWAHGMNEVDPSVSLYPASTANAFSVRCLKD